MSALAQRLDEDSCPAHEAIAFALAHDLGATGVSEARERLRAIADGLPRGLSPVARLGAIADLLRGELAPAAGGPLLLPDVLDGGGHPAGAAVAAAAIAARAGYGVDLVGRGRHLFLAHPDGGVLVVDPARARLFDARTLECDLRWRCAHESAALVLDRVIERAERTNDLTTGLAGAALRLALPVDDDTRARYEREH
ncbi:MAG TPA: hypothetical protein VFZ89_10730, partial [Solirubrobacteraceae bacterium]